MISCLVLLNRFHDHLDFQPPANPLILGPRDGQGANERKPPTFGLVLIQEQGVLLGFDAILLLV
jgi:hypothetical protein